MPSSKLNKKFSGITLVEIMVAFFIFSLVAAGLYKIMKYFAHQRTVIEARAISQKEVNLILTVMQKDLSQAKFNTFQNADGTNISIKVNHLRSDGNTEAKTLRYSYNPPRLSRSFNGQAWKIGEHVEKLVLAKTATGQVLIEVKSKVKLDSMLPSEAQTYTQNQVVTLREDMASVNDPHWRNVGDVEGVFDLHGDLMGGVSEDMEAIVQDLHSDLDSLAADARAGIAAKIEEVKQKMGENLLKIKRHLNNLDRQIMDMSWRAVIDPNMWEYGYIGVASSKMKEKLSGMKSARELNWDQVRSCSYGMKIKESFYSLYNAKKELFKAGKDIIDASRELRIDLSSTDGVDTGIFAP
ncbi:prepilin-type N-terminal cleavage/methylation domain-containing protein [bacterium]|nr:prepilin-type N-terminal cleavage/methylation domain-containing protein [bacterium]